MGNRCSGCHDKDAPGAGEYRVGEERPRTPALWGLRLRRPFLHNGSAATIYDAIERHGNEAELTLRDDVDPNALLRELLGRGRVTRFEIREPSLHQIFKRVVGDADTAREASA